MISKTVLARPRQTAAVLDGRIASHSYNGVSMEQPQDRDFLLQGTLWQDALLQAYRSLHITFQSILLAIGIGLVVVPMSSPIFPKLTTQAIVATLLLLCLWRLQIFIMLKMRSIVTARGNDVNYWQRAVILAEQKLPSRQRHFTDFKIHQQACRQNASHLRELFLTDKPISPDQVDVLIGKGKGMWHTRQVVDQQLFAAISFLWVALTLTSIGFAMFGIFAAVPK